MKKALSLTMAAAVMLSCSLNTAAINTEEPVSVPIDTAASSVNTDDAINNAKLAISLEKVKTRLTIPEELSEFSYDTYNDGISDIYNFYWSTENSAEEYKYISATINRNVITSYNSMLYDYYTCDSALAKLSADELYTKAKEAVSMLNPSVCSNIVIDTDSLNISTTNDRATFSIYRIKNGVPVKNDRGRIVISKTTGELLSFNINWHITAAFKKTDKAMSLEDAKQKYAEMIGIYPIYELEYDFKKDEYISSIVYQQSDYGEINAFTGKKSNFVTDGYYGDMEEDSAVEEPEAGGITNGSIFTEAELAEINKDLPYANEEKIRDILEDSKYLIINDEMMLENSNLRKETKGKTDRYYYTANFTSAKYDEDNYWIKQYENTDITLDAETGEIISYHYYDNHSNSEALSIDENAAKTTAAAIAKEFAGDKLTEYGEMQTVVNEYYSYNGKNQTKYYSGTSHHFDRYANDIKVNGNFINIALDANNKLTSYRINYIEADFISPNKMLTADEIMDIYWENNDLDLYYLAATTNKLTKTVLVYGTDSTIYCDAFTGEQKYNWDNIDTDLSGIKTASIKEKAQILVNHGFIIGTGKFSENDAVSENELYMMLNFYRYYPTSENGADKKLTRGEAMIIITKSACGDDIPSLKGIFKSPYSDVRDDDENVGYYAIAYALTGSTAKKLNASELFTYGEMIELVYNMLANN